MRKVKTVRQFVVLLLVLFLLSGCGTTAPPGPEDKTVLADQEELLKASAWKKENGYFCGPLSGKGGLAASFGDKTDGFPVTGGFRENTQYTISYTGKTAGGSTVNGTGFRVRIWYTDGTSELGKGIPNSAAEDVRITAESAAGRTVAKISLTYGTNNKGTWYIKDFTVTEKKTEKEPWKADKEPLPALLLRFSELPDPIPVGKEAPGYEAFIRSTWDTLLADFPERVEKSTVIGSSVTDTVTEQYDIYKYVITPERGAYSRTVLLTAGAHGAECEGYWGLYRIMRLLLDEKAAFPALNGLRRGVRFVIIPSWNPWGIENQARTCPYGFRPEKNLNARVEQNGVRYDAFTCREAQSIKMVMDEYPDISLWIDFHTDPFAGGESVPARKGCYGYAVSGSSANRVLYALTEEFQVILEEEFGCLTEFTIYDTGVGAGSGLPGYGTGRGIPSVVAEVSTRLPSFPFASGSPEMMKLAEEWYLNLLMRLIAFD